MAPVKKTKFSKKTKKAWRFTDITDVENFYEDKLHEERLGGSLSEKHDDKLFAIDKEAQDTSKKTSVVFVSAREKKKRAQQPPKCFQSLENESKVEDPISKRNILRTKEKRQSVIQKDIERKRKEKEAATQEKLPTRKQRIQKMKRKKKLEEARLFKNNAWLKKEVDVGEWLEEDTTRHLLTNTGQLDVKIPKLTHLRPSHLPSIETPHPGLSYNPTRRAHSDLQRVAAEQRKKLRDEEKRLHRLTASLTRMSAQRREADWIAEMSSGLEEAKNKEPEVDDGLQYKAVNPPAKLKIKTLKKKKRAKQIRKEEVEKRERKVEKKKMADLYRLRFLEEEIADEEAKSAVAKEKRLKKKETKLLKTKVLGSIKFREPLVEVKPRIQLKNSNLRKLAPKGCLLADRSVSLQRRNIIEPRIRTGRLHKKVGKTYFKKGYKMDEEAELKKYTSKKN
ncbi:ribosome biogenesis protein NOP53 [Nilaparvata lugens]|uniref:ribosome biogenesis protein NOP53 n=1 Tax=Nilaparvata lugens TaxID=108931 RepID=UPI00193D9B47|nr:ribosome biogenesis protein NOP53 [Nilaparvata lugens]